MSTNGEAQAPGLLEEVFDGLWNKHGGAEVLAAAESGTWPAELWRQLAAADFPWVSVPESAGGPGGDLADGCAVWRSAGRAPCPLPLGETALAGWLLHAAGLDVPRAAMSVFPGSGSLRAERSARGLVLTGHAQRVPWARDVDHLVGLVPAGDGLAVVCVPSAALTVERGRNLAGEPRDEVTATNVPLDAARVAAAPGWLRPGVLRQRGALLRVQQMAGAMEAAVARTVGYSSERVQFGRPIGRFQAVAHLVVQAAEEAAAARMAADVAAMALSQRAAAGEVGAAKAVAGEAAAVVSANCHQVHGAIGMTHEYPLHYWSRRLWSWREEFGSTAYWRRHVGETMLRRGAAGLWPMVSADAVGDTVGAEDDEAT